MRINKARRDSEGSCLLGPFLFWCWSLQVQLRESVLLFCMAATRTFHSLQYKLQCQISQTFETLKLFFLHQADGSTASLALPAFATSALPQRSCREKSGPQAPTKFSDSKTQRSVETCSETREFLLGRSVSGHFVDVWCRAVFDCDYFMCK